MAERTRLRANAHINFARQHTHACAHVLGGKLNFDFIFWHQNRIVRFSFGFFVHVSWLVFYVVSFFFCRYRRVDAISVLCVVCIPISNSLSLHAISTFFVAHFPLARSHSHNKVKEYLKIGISRHRGEKTLIFKCMLFVFAWIQGSSWNLLTQFRYSSMQGNRVEDMRW